MVFMLLWLVARVLLKCGFLWFYDFSRMFCVIDGCLALWVAASFFSGGGGWGC